MGLIWERLGRNAIGGKRLAIGGFLLSVLVVSACRTDTPTADPQAVAEREFAAELAGVSRPPLPSGARLGVVCCSSTSVAGTPVGAVLSVTLPAIEDPLAQGTTSVSLGEGWRISQEGDVLARPDMERALGEASYRTLTAMSARRAAHEYLRSLAVYRTWQRRRLSYTTVLAVHPRGGGHTIYFRLVHTSASATVEPNSVELKLDREGVVMGAWAGAGRTPL